MIPQLLAAALGAAIMLAPGILALDSATSDLLWLLGPIATSIGIAAASDVLRGVRRANVLVGAAAVVGVVLVAGTTIGAGVAIASGVALIILGLLPSTVHTSFGGGWRRLWE